MSMNLYCSAVELPQIGTYDSYMIYSNEDGGHAGICYRLEQYFRRVEQDRFNYLVNEPARQDDVRQRLIEQLEELDRIRKQENVEWWVM